jgi:dihydrodipicolinate synthase/N-acetylneuraminate lyase
MLSIMTKIPIAERRTRLLQQLFPGGVPELWCPSLTHYDRDGKIDAERISAHLRTLSPHVKGFLIPGSTGDGWDLTKLETRQLLEIVLDEAPGLGSQLLVGILKPTAKETLEELQETAEWLQSRTAEKNLERSLAQARVCGFAVCAPRGKDVPQEEISRALVSVLQQGLPIALYQLPQMTQNEFSPEIASKLAAEFENFLLFKDSSGADRVVSSGQEMPAVFTMRGAEGDYSRWLKAAGGPYDGFLLSTANCFAPELRKMMQDLAAGRREEARELSGRLTSVINEVFRSVSSLPHGNPFTNANKAMDHFFAFGPNAAKVPPPTLHGGHQLPTEAIREAGNILGHYAFMPRKGYLE